MLMRSTGLGKTELVANIQDLKAQGDHLILYVDTTEPVRWKVRTTITLRDIMIVGRTICAARFYILGLKSC